MNFAEKTITKRLFDNLRAAGHLIAVDYNEGGDKPDVPASDDYKTVLNGSNAVDDCWWLIGTPDADGKFDHWIRFIWGNGNDGCDCVSDYSVSLEPIIRPVFDWIEAEIEAS